MGTEELAERLTSIAEELADLAISRLGDASSALARGKRPDPAILAAERRLTRARRAVEKAVLLLREPSTDEGER